ncbi:unnamed protein product [Cyclocybe aegerita]|uniref:HTH CENPB-type domain-containing protein n=1 Tax=Cyclocybe aegerita TaxID=1973307 RepID=A0A8S0X0M3_CYCAE|nr:unnamed protein product [Cyclocybe aegerita]
MAKHAASDVLKKRQEEEEKARAYWIAHAIWLDEQQKPKDERLSYQEVAEEAHKRWHAKTGHWLKLNHNTVRNHATGKTRPREETKWDSSHLSAVKEEEVVNYLIETAAQGFGLSHRRLKEHVIELCRAHYGTSFPGLGKHWSHRFVERHHEHLHVYRTRPLHDVQGKAANPENHKAWCDLVENANGDEGEERVIGGAGKNVQYQQQAGTRETTTVIVNICADGTAIPPAVLFSGKGFAVRWKQDNPAEAMLGYSKKGWTDNEIGIEYAKHFERMTREKAGGRWRVLYVDGHGSHVTRRFLMFCKAHKIHVLCYPAHTTHIYQGLDVVIFSPMKQRFGENRDKLFRETGQEISKENFLKVYGDTHLAILQPELIKKAFSKTGIIPFNLEPPAAVRIMTELIIDTLQPIFITSSPNNDSDTDSEGEDEGASEDAVDERGDEEYEVGEEEEEVVADGEQDKEVEDGADEEVDDVEEGGGEAGHEAGEEGEGEEQEPVNDEPAHPRLDTFPIRAALEELANSDCGFLFSQMPIPSSSNPPDLPNVLILPMKRRITKPSMSRQDVTYLTTKTTSTPNEDAMQEALIAKAAAADYYKEQAIRMQSMLVLQRLYCNKLRRQLQVKEGKAERKKKGRGAVKEHEDAKAKEARDKEERAAQQLEYEERMAAWQAHEDGREARNVALYRQFQEDANKWTAARVAAKEAGRKLKVWDKAHPKPLRLNYKETRVKPPTKKARKDPEEDPEEDVGGDVHPPTPPIQPPPPTTQPAQAAPQADNSGEEFDFSGVPSTSTNDEGQTGGLSRARARPRTSGNTFAGSSTLAMRPASPAAATTVTSDTRAPSASSSRSRNAALDIAYYFVKAAKASGKQTYCRFCKEKSASNPKLKFEFSANTSNTTLRNHLENVHKEEYLHLCAEKGWNNLLPKSRVQVVVAPEAAHGTQGAFRTPFTQKAFIQHLINFVVADDQVGHWTLDNASVNAKFLEELQVLLEARDIPFNAKDRHIMCFPHVINICVTHVIESFTDLALTSDEAEFAAALPPADPCQQTFDKACAQDPIALCHGAVCAICASGKRRKMFQDIIRDGNEKEWFKAANDPNKIIKLENLELLHDVQHRWDSLYKMIC